MRERGPALDCFSFSLGYRCCCLSHVMSFCSNFGLFVCFPSLFVLLGFLFGCCGWPLALFRSLVAVFLFWWSWSWWSCCYCSNLLPGFLCATGTRVLQVWLVRWSFCGYCRGIACAYSQQLCPFSGFDYICLLASLLTHVAVSLLRLSRRGIGAASIRIPVHDRVVCRRMGPFLRWFIVGLYRFRVWPL